MNSARAWRSLLGPSPAHVHIIDCGGLNRLLRVVGCRAYCSLDDQGRWLFLHRPAQQNTDQQHKNNQQNGLYKVFFAKLSLASVAKLSTCPEIPTQSNDLCPAGRAKIRTIDCEDRHDCEGVPSTRKCVDYNPTQLPFSNLSPPAGVPLGFGLWALRAFFVVVWRSRMKA
jgi:hypothetical protein